MRDSKPKGSFTTVQQRLSEAFAEYRLGLQRFLQGRSRVPQTAEDLAQEVYLRVLRFPPDEVVQQPQAYLYRIAANVVHDFNLRVRSSMVSCDPQVLEDAADSGADVWRDEVAESVADHQEIEHLLSPLPAAWRAAIVLRHRDGCSHEEIAQRLGTSVEAVKKYLVRGQARLRLFRRAAQAQEGR